MEEFWISTGRSRSGRKTTEAAAVADDTDILIAQKENLTSFSIYQQV